MSASIAVTGNVVEGEIAIVVSPGMRAQERDRALDAILAGPLSDAATELDAVLASAPHRFAKPIAGKDGKIEKDAEGRTRFKVRGRTEGGRLVPALTH